MTFVRRLMLADASTIAELHRSAFPDFFLTSLGHRFLTEYYAAFAQQSEVVALVAESDDGKLLGAVVGPLEGRSYLPRLVRARLRGFVFAIVAIGVRRPGDLIRLLRRLRGSGCPPNSSALLSSICVSMDAQGMGVGRLLLDSWWKAVRNRGIPSARLTTDAVDNCRVNRFYSRAGWEHVQSFVTTEGRVMNCYSISDPAVNRGQTKLSPSLERLGYVGFANAKLPDTDYRVAYARDSKVCRVSLALPAKPDALPSQQYLPLPVGEGLSPSAALQLLRIPAILRRENADVAHFFATQFVLVGPILARLAGVSSVVTITGLGRSFHSTGWRRTYRLAYLLAIKFLVSPTSDRLLFQNVHDRDQLLPWISSRHRHKIAVIGSAVDEAAFIESRNAGPVQANVCLMVARVHESKGVDDFLAMASDLQGKARFVLAGPMSSGAGELKSRVERAAEQGLIDYLGPVSHAVIRELYTEAAVVVLPSRTEGMPRVVLEAAMAKRAIVTYDIPACQAALPNNLLVRCFEQREFIDRVRALLGDDVLRASAAEAGHVWVRERYGIGRYVRDLDGHVSAVTGRVAVSSDPGDK